MLDILERLTEPERKWLDDMDMFKNEHGVYLFISEDQTTRIDLAGVLCQYRQHLIEHPELLK